MSEKILRELNSSNFRRRPVRFKAAVLMVALKRGLIAYAPAIDCFVRADNLTILIGLLPDADGNWTVLREPSQ